MIVCDVCSGRIPPDSVKAHLYTVPLSVYGGTEADKYRVVLCEKCALDIGRYISSKGDVSGERCYDIK